jgi:RHS repeat-associated protein
MSEVASRRTSIIGAALFSLVIACLLMPVGLIVWSAVADPGTGGPNPPSPVVPLDSASDEVAATAAEFRVDESGAATYSIPIYAVPGTAGVTPKLSLNYSSQGGYGPLGKGWSIGGLSSITRCRATREAGDFIVNGVPTDGNPRPISYSGDKVCLDGQRLITVSNSPACASVAGMAVQQLRTEIESFQRICAYTPTGGTTGPAFFTVERKDGSISWYGDRVSNGAQNLGFGGYFNSTAPGKEAYALMWAQTRFQDSTGNQIDFVYSQSLDGVVGEHLLREVRYTGRAALPGQTAPARVPYAKIAFGYSLRSASSRGKGYQSGGVLTQAHQLDAVFSCSVLTNCTADGQVRYYQLSYGPSPSGSALDTLRSVQECRDSSLEVCLPATRFEWSTAKFSFTTTETSSTSFALASDHFRGYKHADINGDGRQDLVVLYLAGSGCVNGSWVVSFLGSLNGSGQPILGNATFNCVPAKIYDRGEGAWHLFDYDGDGKDDLFVSSYAGQGWKVHPSNGVHFDMSTNLISGLSPIIPSVEAKNDQVQLADLNGDGLTDIVYPSGGALRARIMTRSGGAFVWGAQRTISVDMASLGPPDSRCGLGGGGYDCTRTVAGAPTPKTGFIQLADFNGDAASDLLMQENESGFREIYGTPQCPYEPRIATTFPDSVEDPEGGGTILPYRYESQTPETEAAEVEFVARAVPSGDCTERFQTVTLHAMAVKSVTSTIVTVGSVAQSAGNPHALSLGDVNGDGLTDLFARSSSNSAWAYRPNTGTGFGSWVSLPASSFEDFTRFADVNGDGRTDVLQLVDTGSRKAYYALMALPTGGYGTRVALPGGNAKVCDGSGCDERKYAPAFGDYDGDGVLDFMSLNMGSSTVGVYFSRALATHSARDVIVKVTNGLDAVTQMKYAPLTNAAIYRRESGTRNTTNWGRGSPVLDFLAPIYVVASASSSSPQDGNPNALATVHYRYADAKVQAGGRGFLGFGYIVTFDPNHAGGHISTKTVYAQNFPFAGMPIATAKRAVAAAYAVPACLTGTITNSCFATPGQGFPGLTGTMFTANTQDWEADADSSGTAFVAFAPGVQAPLHVRTSGTVEKLYDPNSGVQTSQVLTAFDYGAYGNVTLTAVDTYTGTSTLVSTVSTANYYQDDDAAKWRLGRLTETEVTHARPGKSAVVRRSRFDYAMSGPATGLLIEERSQPGGPVSRDLRKLHAYDDYGNRVRTVTCLPSTSSCDPTALVFHPSTLEGIHRYSRIAYDGAGRYPVKTYEPFWNGTNSVEKATSEVIARDIFGNVTHASDVNGVETRAIAGKLGRAYFTWVQTEPSATLEDTTSGVRTLATYRWCGDVTCPTGAKFRQQVLTTEAPSQWTYFDVLGRPIMQAVATFNEGVAGKDIAATCTTYDATGKPKRVSHPFFLPGVLGSNGPSVAAAACTGAALWTTTTYDLIGRVVKVESPDVGGTRTVTTAYASLKTTVTDARNNATEQTRNGKGELVQTKDAAGLVTNYTYYADGTLYQVSRNAGRGAVVNSFVYDVLGRKVQQDDPDTGLSTFEYNALGELVRQTDAAGHTIEHWHDARGRVWRKVVRTAGNAIESQSDFVFDTAANGLGQLASESITGTYTAWVGQAGSALGFSRSYTYDVMGRPTGTTTTIDGTAYTTAAVHDARGRVWKAQDASGRWSKTAFRARGFTNRVCNSSAADADPLCAPSGTYLQTLETDAWGHVVRERRGNSAAMDVSREYWAQTGRIASLCAGNATTCNLMDEGYGWDKAGSLTSHQKETRYLESFNYDTLNRLRQGRLLMQDGVTVNSVYQDLHYDALGNLCRRMTAGWATREYTYLGRSGCGLGDAMNSAYGSGTSNAYGAHQVGALVEPVNGHVLSHYYDVRGNQTVQQGASSDRTLHYSADGLAVEASTSGQRTRFWYGSDGQRYKRLDGTKKTLYLGNVEIVVDAGVTTVKRTIAGVMLQTVVGATATNHYLFHDQLGSLVRITNAAGAVMNSMDFLALGGRRNVDTQHANGTAPTLTTRGFTGHEMVDGLNLVHMNGRIYDAYQGRFLQADPLVQAPGNAQSWNAYTYVFNNPLSDTDPTGMFSLRQALAVVIGVVAAVFGQYYITQGMYMAAFGVAVAGGFAAGYVASGTLKGGLQGAFTAALTFGVGAAVQGADVLIQMGAQAVTGGVIESLQGGSFGHGFAAAGLTAAFMPQAGHRNVGARAVRGALIGGTISAATGGKFANGAMSGAIQAAMSGQEKSSIAQDGFSEPGDPRLALETSIAAQDAMITSGAFRSDGFASEQAAANAFWEAVGGVALRAEVGVLISQGSNGRYHLGDAYSDGARGHVSGLIDNARRAPGTVTAFAHTHPDVPNLSGGGYGYRFGRSVGEAVGWDFKGDMRTAYTQGMNAYSFSKQGGDYFSLSAYRSMQRQSTETVPLCRAATLGCR